MAESEYLKGIDVKNMGLKDVINVIINNVVTAKNPKFANWL